MQPIKRPSIRRTGTSKSQHPIEIQPDYTEDEAEDCNLNNPVAFSSYYPSGSMTLPHPYKSSQSAEKKAIMIKDQVKKVAEAASEESTTTSHTTTVVSQASGSPKKSLNESGESDPGYESDSSKSKSTQLHQSANSLMTEPKATTLPRRSATVQKNSALQHTLDRRKLRAEEEKKTGTESEAGLTVEIISPVRVPITIPPFS